MRELCSPVLIMYALDLVSLSESLDAMWRVYNLLLRLQYNVAVRNAYIMRCVHTLEAMIVLPIHTVCLNAD